MAAEELVLMEQNCVGTFIVRPSERVPNCFSLTVKDYRSDLGHIAKNYRIKMDEHGLYYINFSLRYKSIAELIADNRESSQTPFLS